MKTLAERFLEKIDFETSKDGCWLWTRCKNKCGYGVIGVNGKIQLAHRVSWQLHNPDKPIPEGMCVCHRCNTPPCVNPDHLWIGTHLENMQDMARQGRSGAYTHPESRPRGERNGTHTHPESVPRGDKHYLRQHPELSLRGERNAGCKLSEDKVRAIFHDQRTLKQIAREYGVSQAVVSLIKNRKLWRHLNLTSAPSTPVV